MAITTLSASNVHAAVDRSSQLVRVTSTKEDCCVRRITSACWRRRLCGLDSLRRLLDGREASAVNVVNAVSAAGAPPVPVVMARSRRARHPCMHWASPGTSTTCHATTARNPSASLWGMWRRTDGCTAHVTLESCSCPSAEAVGCLWKRRRCVRRTASWKASGILPALGARRAKSRSRTRVFMCTGMRRTAADITIS